MMIERQMKRGGVGRAAALFVGITAVSWLVIAPASEAQEVSDLASRIDAAPDGSVRFSYAARKGVCGDGQSISLDHHDGENPADPWCEPGPIWVQIEKSAPRVIDLDWWVGRARNSRDAARTDLGLVGPAEATEYLMSLARRIDGDMGNEAIGAASLAADVIIWPELLDMARETGLDSETREAAIFWLAILAGDQASEGLEEIVRADGDTEVKEAALFGLSQLPDGSGIDALIKVARDNDDPELVQASLFWLGRTGDPRAIALFEEILTQN